MRLAGSHWARIRVTIPNSSPEVFLLTPSPEIIQLLATFEPAMTAPTFANALVLLYGAILAPGRRTIASALRVMGDGGETNPSKYHRVLSRSRWSPWQCSRLLLELL